jgi:hypothetical protein
MTTYGDLQDAVLLAIHSGTVDQEQRCALSAAIDTDDLTFTVDDATQVSRGLIEIDSELLWVKNIDQSSNTVTISPFGRGYGESTAASHSEDAMVVNNPRYPRVNVKNAIQETLNALYPELYQVTTTDLTAVATQVTYGLPADVGWIVKVQASTVGPTGLWAPLKRWKFDPTADTTDYANGKSLDVWDPVTPGQSIKVTYAKPLGALSADADTLTSTGLGEDSRDLLVFGAAARLLQSMEAARLVSTTIEQAERAKLSQPGAATQASRAYWQLFQLRLAEQVAQLQRLHPASTHFTR